MAGRPRIGVACPNAGERAALLEWLLAAGFEPVVLLDFESIARSLEARGFEALIADAKFVTHAEAAPYLHLLGTNRPLIVIGDEDPAAQLDAERREITYLTRPVTREFSMLAVSLALAEGRPTRRSPRIVVARIPATVDEVAAMVIDVSYEGVRLELPEKHRTALGPVFQVQVPMFRVEVLAQRVWIGAPPASIARASAVWCGATLRRNSAVATAAWRTMVDNMPPHGHLRPVR